MFPASLPSNIPSPGYVNVPINQQTANYTLQAGDAANCVYHPASDAAARTFTIPSNAQVSYPLGTVLTFVNMATGANTVTIAINTDTLTLAVAGSTGSRVLTGPGQATAIKIATGGWLIMGANLA